jgi:hypothetical protein
LRKALGEMLERLGLDVGHDVGVEVHNLVYVTVAECLLKYLHVSFDSIQSAANVWRSAYLKPILRDPSWNPSYRRLRPHLPGGS